MRTKVLVGTIFATVFFAAGLPRPSAAQGVGGIAGSVFDTSGAALG